jgi:hypothetical protein
MARNFRRAVAQQAELLEEFHRSQNTLLDLVANLCTSLHEIPYQLHVRNTVLEQGGTSSEVSDSVQQVPKLVERSEVGIQTESEVAEGLESAGNGEVQVNSGVPEDVGTEDVGGEDETMKDA